jgi:REP element-mobilizing transposase RayT
MRIAHLRRIMSLARSIHPGATYLITRRVEQRRCLLRPDSAMTAFIRYAFVMAAQIHEIELHAVCAMSTHFHYVVSDPKGDLPRFLATFHRLVARGVQRIRRWDGAVWNRSQTSIVKLCTREAIVEKIAYTLANPVQAGLVRHAWQWPGFKTSIDDIGKSKIQAERPKGIFDPKNTKWKKSPSLKVTLPPSITRENADAFIADIKLELGNLESAAHAAIPRYKVLGAARARKVRPDSRATSREPRKQRNPSFAVGRGNADALRKEKQALRDFRSAYKKALDEWRSGNRAVVFPAGTYAMRVLHKVNIAPDHEPRHGDMRNASTVKSRDSDLKAGESS